MRASQHRIALLGAGMFFLLSATIGCLQQSISQPSPGWHSSSRMGGQSLLSTTDHIPAGVRLGEYSLAGVRKQELTAHLTAISSQLNAKPRNAHKQQASLNLIPEHPGRQLDIEKTQERILRAKPGEAVEPAWKILQPSVTVHDLSSAAPMNAKQIRQFSTPIIDTKPDRVENIRVTARLLNNTVVEPGEIFSFNKTVGMPTEAKGFKKGTVFGDGGMLTQELGGGMCQVSSTLYNAALDSGMEIIERHPHSKPVAYITNGRDATIYDDKDLRFRNTTGKPVIIKSWISNGRTHVTFYEPLHA